MILREERLSASIAGPAPLAQIEFVEAAGAREVRPRKRVKRKIARLPSRSAVRRSRIQLDTVAHRFWHSRASLSPPVEETRNALITALAQLCIEQNTLDALTH